MDLSACIAIFMCCGLITGITAQLSNVTSCVGDEVVYTCTVPAEAHTWSISTLQDPLTVTRSTPVVVDSPYTARIVEDDGSAINSSLSVISFAEFNGTVISCSDGNAPVGQGDMQETTAMVFDPPSAPGLTVVAIDFQTFNFTITPPSVASQCVLNYTITPTSSDGSVLSDIYATDLDDEAPVTLSESGFDVCNNTYNFTVMANTLADPGERSEVIIPEPIDFKPGLMVQGNFFTQSITGLAPALFTNSTVSIQRSSLESDSCEENVVNRMTSGSSTVTVMETLSCRYAGRRVTYCLQFSTDECQSEIAMAVLSSDTLRLLSSAPEATSSTSDSISLRVDVNEQANCEGVDGLTITATVADNNTVVSTQQADFADTTFEFQSLSPDTYSCSITIADGAGVIIQQEEIECSVTDSGLPVGAIVGGVVGGTVLIVLVVVVVVVMIIVIGKSSKASVNLPSVELAPDMTTTGKEKADTNGSTTGTEEASAPEKGES